MYESPITLITNKMQATYEDGIMKAIQSVGVSVNKKELVKALEYDRDQYMKGYLDGEVECLDKIRAEIKALTDGVEPEHIWNVDVLAIIDKYKAESEE